MIDLYKGPQESRLSSLWGAFPPASAVGREITLAKNKKRRGRFVTDFLLVTLGEILES